MLSRRNMRSDYPTYVNLCMRSTGADPGPVASECENGMRDAWGSMQFGLTLMAGRLFFTRFN